jgi:hypothetical protein
MDKKIVKLKESELTKTITNILTEKEELGKVSGPTVNVVLGIDKQGRHYLIKNPYSENPEIIFTTED